jgi:co-chaperonin GroES (HSP10)
MKLNVRPLPGKIYVRLDEKLDKFGERIFLPDNSRQQTRLGTVLAKGDGCDIVEVGDYVAVPFYAGVYINIPGLDFRDDKHKIMGEKEVMFFADLVADKAEGEEE